MFGKSGFISTAIGSMPFEDNEHAIDVSLKMLDAPAWPQMSCFGLNERMEVQYSEGMPCRMLDREKSRIYFDTSGDYSEDLAAFYEAYMAAMDPDEGTGDCSPMAIGPDFAKGIYSLEGRLKAMGAKLPIIKLQTCGPVTFGLSVVDENKRAMWYNEEFRDVIIKTMAMKSRWQIQKFGPFAEKVICFIDEPILAAFGCSTYVSVKREDVVGAIMETADAIHADGGISGIHCCGNTEWIIPIDAGVNIVSFDAFEFGETIAMYIESVKSHLERGGVLAWGVVPSSVAIRQQTVESLESHLERIIGNLTARGIDKQLILEHSMITPSCGTGSMEPADAEKVFELTAALTKRMNEKYGV